MYDYTITWIVTLDTRLFKNYYTSSKQEVDKFLKIYLCKYDDFHNF